MTLNAHDQAIADEFVARIDAVADDLAATAAESERLGHLAPRALELLHQADLYRIAVPTEVGGLGLHPVVQMRVIERLAEIDTACAWNIMVSNNSASFMGAYLGDAGVAEVFADGVPNAAGVGPTYGQGTPVQGGYRVSGVFRICSGANHAAWFRFHTVVDGEKRCIVVPREAVRLLDNWDVLGLRGSGSPDVELDDIFVPEHMTFPREERLRGGPHFLQRDLAWAACEHAAIAIGLGRRAVRMAREHLAARPVLPETALLRLGRSAIAIEAAARAVESHFAEVTARLDVPGADVDAVSADNPAWSAYAQDVAMECLETARRLVGTKGLYLPNEFDLLLRDAVGAGQHVCVAEFHFGNAARRLVGGAVGG